MIRLLTAMFCCSFITYLRILDNCIFLYSIITVILILGGLKQKMSPQPLFIIPYIIKGIINSEWTDIFKLKKIFILFIANL